MHATELVQPIVRLVMNDEIKRLLLSSIRYPALEPGKRRWPVVVRLTSHQIGTHSILLSRTGQARDARWVARHEVAELGDGVWSVPDDLAQEKGFI